MPVINPTPGPLGRRFLGRKMHFSWSDVKIPGSNDETRCLTGSGSARAAEKWRGSGTEAVAGGKTMQVREGGNAPPPARRATARTLRTFNGPRESRELIEAGPRHRRRKRFESSRQQNTSVTRDTCRLTRICIPIPPRIPPPAPSRRLAGAATARYSDPAAQAPLPSSGRGGCYELLRALHLS